ncbi:hypothetical protein IFR05_015528 [Cadophora sp. M221]|nr:hypothetical protein IFR05_015528 [Cadophora sp. M221]
MTLSYTLTSPSAPAPPPLVNKELYLEHLRRYPTILELLPDPAPDYPQPPQSTPHQRICFNPLTDTIFTPLPTLCSFAQILSSPTSLQTLSRFIGFDQILNLSNPLENPNIRGLAFLERWLFTSLPPYPSLPPLKNKNDNDAAINLLSKIHTDLTFNGSDPATNTRRAYRHAAREMTGRRTYSIPNPTPEQVLELRHRAGSYHVWRLMQNTIENAVENFFANYYFERFGLDVARTSWSRLGWRMMLFSRII